MSTVTQDIKMDDNYYGSYTSLLNDDSPANEERYGVNPTIPLEDVIEVDVPRRTQRSANFSVEEDICIVSAWLNTSKDPIHGNDQKSQGFWKRIYDQFVEHYGQGGRTKDSVENHWRDINTQCSKFIGILRQIDNRHQSGQTQQGRLEEARVLYRSTDKKNRKFRYEHCLEILKHERKWFDNFETITEPTSVEDHSESSANKDRPLGRKAAKTQQKRKQGSNSEGGSSSKVDERWEEKLTLERDRYAERERLISELKVATHGDEERREMEIMMKDTTGMEESHIAYWNMKKNEVLKRNGLV